MFYHLLLFCCTIFCDLCNLIVVCTRSVRWNKCGTQPKLAKWVKMVSSLEVQKLLGIKGHPQKCLAYFISSQMPCSKRCLKWTEFINNVLTTGDITVKDQSCLNYESNKRVHLVVLAENGQQTTYARVTVNLLDVNDNAPTFKQAYYRTAVWEGQIHNTYVMQVRTW